jgi:hypothetical protein
MDQQPPFQILNTSWNGTRITLMLRGELDVGIIVIVPVVLVVVVLAVFGVVKLSAFCLWLDRTMLFYPKAFASRTSTMYRWHRHVEVHSPARHIERPPT